MADVLELSEPDPAWAHGFEAVKSELVEVLGPAALRVEHIGSTAVPGLLAKPTIDVLLVVESTDVVLRRLDAVSALGFAYRPEARPDPTRHLFLKREVDGRRTHHLHVVPVDSHEVDDYLAIRDFLRSHPHEVDAYATLKRDLQAIHGGDRAAYVAAKPEFVEELLVRARRWRDVGWDTEPGPHVGDEGRDRRPRRGRYARLEREQRWLLRRVPTGAEPSSRIADRYIRGTTLRLRQVTDRDDAVTWKLTQKVRLDPEDPERVMTTNTYLADAEREVLVDLSSDLVVKDRFHVEWSGRRYAVDRFGGLLVGLVLAEVELTEDDAPLPIPPFAVTDVTHDDRFSGGTLAADPRAAVRAAHDLVAIHPTDQRAATRQAP